MKITIKLIQTGNEIIATCPELDINCYGSDKEEASRRIQSVIHFYVDSARSLGLDVEQLNEISFEGEINSQINMVSILSASDSIH